VVVVVKVVVVVVIEGYGSISCRVWSLTYRSRAL